jgi:hypothetical protein
VAKPKRTLLEFDKRSKEVYEKLRKELRGEKADLSNKEAFMIAVAWGWANQVRVEEIIKSGTGPRVEYLDESDTALLKAVHFSVTESSESLNDIDAIHTTAEQYAEGGIRLLRDLMNQPGNFVEKFTSQVSVTVESIQGTP